jgi:hypothetical protein
VLGAEAYCYPAREVGGDFFESFTFILQGDIWLARLVMKQALKVSLLTLFMASAISLLGLQLTPEISPGEPGCDASQAAQCQII